MADAKSEHNPWSRQLFEDLKAQADGVLEAAAADGPQAVRDAFAAALARLADPANAAQAAERLVYILALLNWHGLHGGWSSAQINQLMASAEAILKVQGVRSGSSKLAYLHGELWLAASRISHRGGEQFTSLWQSQIARGIGRRHTPGGAGAMALVTAQRALRQGDTVTAADGFRLAEAGEASPAGKRAARLGRLRTLRLSGEPAEAKRLAAAAADDVGLDTALGKELAWEALCRDAQADGAVEALVAAAQTGQTHALAPYTLEAQLWGRACASRACLERLPKAMTIRRKLEQRLDRASPLAALFEAVEQLEQCYDEGIPLELRVVSLGEVLARAHRLAGIDHELLLWCASARWLLRMRQYMLAGCACGEYRGLSLKLSNGASPDVLGLAADMVNMSWFSYDASTAKLTAPPEALHTLPAAGSARAAAFSRLGIAVASATIKGRVRRVLAPGGKQEELLAQQHQEVSRLLFDGLGRLKGPAVKLAQVTGFFLPDMPPAVRLSLTALQDQAQPMDSQVIRNLVEQELGRPLAESYPAWSDEPVGAASIGQVHWARSGAGQQVAVKVQYPGVDAAIRADGRFVRLLAPLFKGLFPGVEVTALLDASVAMLLEECDYRREAALHERAAAHFAGDPEIVVPRVHADRSTARVLTTDFVDGISFADFVRSASQGERDRAGRIIYRYMAESLFRLGVINGDPNPGNFLFLADGRVAVIDYGFAEAMPAERTAAHRELWRGLVRHEPERYQASLIKLGYVAEASRFDFAGAYQSALAVSEFEGSGGHRFTPESQRQALAQTVTSTGNRPLLSLPVGEIRAKRMQLVVGWLLAELRAQADWRAVVEPFL